MSVVESMIAGAIAGSATVLVTNPIWVVNVSYFIIILFILYIFLN
jgi:hypothetical protein